MTLVCLVLLWAGSVASSADPGSTESAKRGSRDAKAEAVINVGEKQNVGYPVCSSAFHAAGRW